MRVFDAAVRRLLAFFVIVASTALTVPLLSHSAYAAPPPKKPATTKPAISAPAQPRAGQYTPLVAARIASAVTIAGGATYTQQISGQIDMPAASQLAAAVFQLSAQSANAGGLTVYSADLTTAPGVTSVNFQAGNVPTTSLVTTAVGATTGQVKIKNSGTATATFWLDTIGWYAKSGVPAAGSTYVGITPTRLVGGTTLAGGATTDVTVAGAIGIPAANVTAVAANLIFRSGTAGALAAYPVGAVQLNTTVDLSFRADAATYYTNMSIVKLSGGKFTVKNRGAASGTLYVDVQGYYQSASGEAAGSTYVNVSPARAVNGATINAGATYTASLLGTAGLPTSSAATVTAVELNLTTKSTGNGQLVVYPNGQTAPGTASVYYKTGSGYWGVFQQAKLGAGNAFVIKNTGTTAAQIYLDVVGYQSGPAVPGAPTGAAATLSGQTATVTWQPPASDGGAALLDYTVTASPGGATQTTGASTATFSGLTYGTAYTFTVTARNAVGASPASAPTSAVTPTPPVVLPSAPYRVIATPGNQSVGLSWQPPTSNGNAPILDYTVVTSPGGATTVVTQPTATVTGLTDGTEYAFTVQARNSAGKSVPSASSDPVTPAADAPPGQPVITEVYARDSAARITWAPPSTGPGSATSYTVKTEAGLQVAVLNDPTAREYEIGGLTNGTAYRFTVTATRGALTGQPSPLSDYVTPLAAVVPLTPSIVSVTPMNSSVDVQWVPTVDGGTPILDYTVTATDPNGVKTVRTSPANNTVLSVTGLTNGTTYTVSVAARNAVGLSLAAERTGLTPAAQRVPGRPDDLTAASSGSGAVQALWSAPADQGTAALSGYRLTATPDGGGTAAVLDVAATVTTATMTGLDPETAYTVTLAAKNTWGYGQPRTSAETVVPNRAVAAGGAVVTLNAASMDTLRAVHDDGTLDFEQPSSQVTALAAGDIVILADSDLTPNGMTRRITAVTDNSGLHVLSTEYVPITDVYTAASVTSHVELGSADLPPDLDLGHGMRLVQPLLNGRTAAQGAPRSRVSPQGVSFGIRDGALVIEVQVEAAGLAEVRKNSAAGATLGRYEVQLTWKPHFDSGVNVGVGLSGPYVDTHLNFGHEAQLQAQLRFGLLGKVERTLDLTTFRFPCIPTAVGPVCPLVIPHLKLEISVGVAVAFQLTWTHNRSVSIRTHNGSVTHTEQHDPDNGFSDLAVLPAVDFTARLSLPVDFDFAVLGGTVRFGLTIAPYLELRADTTQTPWWELRVGGAISVNLRVDVGIAGFDWQSPPLLDFFYTVAHADGGYVGVLMDPTYAETIVDQPVQLSAQVQGVTLDSPLVWSVTRGAGTVDQNGLFAAHQTGTAEVQVSLPPSGSHPEYHATAIIAVGPRQPDPPGTPGVTGTPTVKAAPLSLDISWPASPFDGGAALTEYDVVVTGDQGDSRTAAVGPTQLSYHMSRLYPSERYTVVVFARNSQGAAPSNSSPPVRPLEALGRPGSVVDVAVDAQGNKDSSGIAGKYGAALSGNGRYAFFWTAAGSNLAPAEISTPSQNPDPYNLYLIRKDLRTGEIILASRDANGAPVPAMPSLVAGPVTQHLTPGVAVSDDGDQVAYVSALPYHLSVVELSTNTHWLTVDLGNTYPAKIRLSGDGSTVVYAASRFYRYQRGDAAPARVDRCAASTYCVIANLSTIDVTADGSKVVYGCDGDPQPNPECDGAAWLYDATTGSHVDLRSDTSSTCRVTGPRISGDGTRVAAGVDCNGTRGLAVGPAAAGSLGTANLVVSGSANIYIEAGQLSYTGNLVTFLNTPHSPPYLAGEGVARFWNIAQGGSSPLVGPSGTSRLDWSVSIARDDRSVLWTRKTCTLDAPPYGCTGQPGVWLQKYSG